MSILKNLDDLEKLKYSSLILASALNLVKKNAKPGVSAGKLNELAETFIYDHGGKPSFKGLYGFPHTLITEINDEVVHGLSDKKKILPEIGVVSFDCGVIYDGLYSDMAICFTLGEVDWKVKMLVDKTHESLWAGIKAVKVGKRVGDIGFAVNSVLEKAGLGNVTALGGHGLGYVAHDEPHITHKGKPGTGARLFENQVLAIEPMVTLGSPQVLFEPIPGASVEVIKTVDGSWAAHEEHTVLVTKKGFEVLTDIETSKYLV